MPLPHPDLAPYKLDADDQVCRPGCIHYGRPGEPLRPHSHWQPKDQPAASSRRNGLVMRWLIRLYSSEWHWPGIRHNP